MKRSGDARRAEGWAHPSATPKAHYFGRDDVSLCGVWLLERGFKVKSYDADTCVRCRRKLEQRKHRRVRK